MSGILSTGPSEPLTVDGLPWPLVLSHHPRARRLTLRLDSKNHRLKLTCPRAVSRKRALEWALGQRAWVLHQVDLQGAPVLLAPDAVIPFDGTPHRLIACPDRPRGATVVDGALEVGGPLDGFAGRVGRWLREEARRRLTVETDRIAVSAGIAVTSVSIGDADTRWGSCSHDGRIRFSWRLLLAPPEVRRYVVAHEVAHRLHMDHSPAFRAAERRLFGGDPAPARAELRRLSPALRRVRLP